MLVLCGYLNLQRIANFDFKIILQLKNYWLPFFEKKFRIKELPISVISKTLKSQQFS
jgi:hypothetical protein